MYCLSWNSYKNNICNGFARLQQREEFVDMTLVAEGHLVKVHKSLISLASPYIKNVIKSVPCSHPIIFLANIKHKVLCQLLEYVYTGEVHVDLENLDSFIKAAKELQLPGIANNLSDAPGLNNGQSASFPEPIPIGNKINLIENSWSPNTKPGNAAVDSNINGILNTNTSFSQNQALTPTNLSNENAVPGTLPINKIEILENREVNIVTSDAATKTNANDIILDFDMATSESVNDIVNMPFATILINEPLSNNPDGLHKVNNIQILENRHLDRNGAVETNNMKNILDTNVPLLQNDEDKKTVAVSDGANYFDEFLKFTDRKNATTNVYNTTQQSKKIEINLPTNNDKQHNFSLDSVIPHYTMSNKGSLQMILNRYIYSMHYSANGGVKRRWRCIDYRILRCSAFIDTVNDKITKRKNCHVHNYHDHKIKMKSNANLIFGALSIALQETKKRNDMEDSVQAIESVM